MKHLILCLALLVSSFAQAEEKSVSAEAGLTKKLLDFLAKQDSSFSGGMYQGFATFSAQIECGTKNLPEGELNLAKLKCYARPIAGFSRNPELRAVLLSKPLANELKVLFANNNMNYMISNGWSVLGAKIMCQKNEGAGEEAKDECQVSK